MSENYVVEIVGCCYPYIGSVTGPDPELSDLTGSGWEREVATGLNYPVNFEYPRISCAVPFDLRNISGVSRDRGEGVSVLRSVVIDRVPDT